MDKDVVNSPILSQFLDSCLHRNDPCSSQGQAWTGERRHLLSFPRKNAGIHSSNRIKCLFRKKCETIDLSKHRDCLNHDYTDLKIYRKKVSS
ncbi:hypothetical protein MBAV_005696 [Candidatus Magnetobacterium bavaricum]|uniref:Uncharacterized protein n=1 Tax=Candidatus Magnetobacterium bavaricum TaxID=29290 RepID=A0A0F3GJG7_9BACT|nr:hypothetical protein MBAV_005696 [Candidatus Magnetobacterium bavaricum]